MELWIRSQDKKRLMKVVYFELEKDDYGFHILGREDKFSGNKLGTYKTEERALEVLDEIQNALLNKWANNVKYEEHYDDETPRSLVYEMPKE